MAEPRKKKKVSDLILSRQDDQDDAIVLEPETVDEEIDDEVIEEVEETQDDIIETDEKEGIILGEDEEEPKTIGDMFLDRAFKFDVSLAHRLVADLVFTNLSEVVEELRKWYIKQSPSEFATYETAKIATYQFLITQYTEFDNERNFAHAVAHWFVSSLGLRKKNNY